MPSLRFGFLLPPGAVRRRDMLFLRGSLIGLALWVAFPAAGALGDEALRVVEPASQAQVEGATADARRLEIGRSYRAAGRMVLASARNALAEEQANYLRVIPAGDVFQIADVVNEGETRWYLLNSSYRYGWVDANRLAAIEVVSSGERVDECAPAKAKLRRSLDDLHRQLVGLGAYPTIEQLVALDARIRKTLGGSERCRGDVPLDDRKNETLGLSIGHWSGAFEYSGRLLRQAHAIDPRSTLRPATLYSTVERADASESVALPDFRAARAYLGEFPDGPFAADAALHLAGAYRDAYLTRHCDHHLDCVADQLDDLQGRSKEEQERRSREMAEHYVQQSFRLRSPEPTKRESWTRWQECPPGYVFCAD